MSKKYNILVSGVGAIIGYGVIKSLRKMNISCHIVGMDIYEDAVGKNWCDKFVQAKYAVDPDYPDFIKNIIDENNIDLVFFGTEQEIYRIGLNMDEFKSYENKFVVNKLSILELAKDKWETYRFLIENGLEENAIPSVIKGDYNEISEKFGNRFMLKPRSSYASKGIEIVENEEEFNFFKKRMGSGFMAQPLVGDAEHEYTVAVFGLGDGSFSNLIAMKRKLSQEGATAKASVVHDGKLVEVVERLANTLKPIGPTNFQFRYHQGKYLLLEVNPRISSSTSIRTAFGYNESELSVLYFLEGITKKVEVKDGVAVRYIDEVAEVR